MSPLLSDFGFLFAAFPVLGVDFSLWIFDCCCGFCCCMTPDSARGLVDTSLAPVFLSLGTGPVNLGAVKTFRRGLYMAFNLSCGGSSLACGYTLFWCLGGGAGGWHDRPLDGWSVWSHTQTVNQFTSLPNT